MTTESPIAVSARPPRARLPRVFPRVLWALTVCAWIGLFVATHIPARSMPDVHVSDKLLHFVAYFGLASMIYLSTWIANPARRWTAATVLAICMVYGAIDELLQPFVNRNADVMDWVYDVLGATAAVVLLAMLRWAVTRRVPHRAARAQVPD